MSDEEFRGFEYTALSIHDGDGDQLKENSRMSKGWPSIRYCISGLIQWMRDKVSYTLEKDDQYPILCAKCFFKVMCLILGKMFCNNYVKGLYMPVYGRFKCIYLHYCSRDQEETTRSKYRRLKQFDEEDLKEENRRLRARIQEEKHKKEIAQESLEEERREKGIKLTRLQKEYQEKENALKRIYFSLEEERHEKKRLLTRLQQESQEKENALKSLEEERREKERALTRLSAVAGDKLRLNNPGIADLSDENRPNKLAEKFSELYDNEWTEVFEALEEEHLEEERIIEMLLDFLKEIYNSCLKIADNQRKSLTEAIAKPSKSEFQLETSPEGIMSKVIDLQKQTASVAFSDVKNTICQMKAMSQFKDHKVKEKYLDRCVQLCWMMSIQDPPMMLDFGPGKDEEVDKNTFRMYTKQGDRVDFIVWPAVFLHENGPLVQKGVLQPK